MLEFLPQQKSGKILFCKQAQDKAICRILCLFRFLQYHERKNTASTV